jgi:restriction system protein
MRLPKYNETFIPILKTLSNGDTISINDLRKRVRDEFYMDLPEKLLSQKTKSGDILVLNRIGWGKAYLKQAKMIHQPKRGMVQITEKGQLILKKGELSLGELIKDSDYQAYCPAKKEEKESVDQSLGENASPEDMIDSGFKAIELQTKSELLEKLKQIDPYYFEKVILRLLNKMGYGDFQETAKSGDGGIDGIINQDQLGLEKIFVQTKRYNENKVREKEIRNFIGAMSGDTSKGIFVTTSTFDDNAIKKTKEAHHKIILIDGEKLVDLMYKFGVGVQVRNTYDKKEIDEDFFEEN